MGKIDYLFDAAVFYRDHLLNKRFLITISRKKEQRSLEILFLPEQFYHLIGLHKLTDLPFLSRRSDNIFREILAGKITYQDICKSVHIMEMHDRLIYYKEMLNVLQADSLFFKSMRGRFKGIFSDCVLTRSVNDTAIYSFLFLKQNQDVYFPCSFFTRNEQREYTKEGTRWEIISVIEIVK